MDEKCFCHFNGLAVKDATARKENASLKHSLVNLQNSKQDALKWASSDDLDAMFSGDYYNAGTITPGIYRAKQNPTMKSLGANQLYFGIDGKYYDLLEVEEDYIVYSDSDYDYTAWNDGEWNDGMYCTIQIPYQQAVSSTFYEWFVDNYTEISTAVSADMLNKAINRLLVDLGGTTYPIACVLAGVTAHTTNAATIVRGGSANLVFTLDNGQTGSLLVNVTGASYKYSFAGDLMTLTIKNPVGPVFVSINATGDGTGGSGGGSDTGTSTGKTIQTGTYVANEDITAPDADIVGVIPFTSNGQSFSKLYSYADDDGMGAWMTYDQTTAYSNGKWNLAGYRTIVINETQAVSAEFYEWFTANFTMETSTGQEYEIPVGTYVANATPTDGGTLSGAISFRANGAEYSRMDTNGGDLRIFYGTTLAYYSQKWSNYALRTVYITGGQPVSQAFYTWFMNNYTKQADSTTEYKIPIGTYVANNITEPNEDIVGVMEFRNDGMTYSDMQVHENGGAGATLVYSNTNGDTTVYAGAWKNNVYRTIYIMDEQTVNQAFHTWFMENFAMETDSLAQSYISPGEYTLPDTLSEPAADCTGVFNFYVNGMAHSEIRATINTQDGHMELYFDNELVYGQSAWIRQADRTITVLDRQLVNFAFVKWLFMDQDW